MSKTASLRFNKKINFQNNSFPSLGFDKKLFLMVVFILVPGHVESEFTAGVAGDI